MLRAPIRQRTPIAARVTRKPTCSARQSGGLRAAEGGTLVVTRALADNARLWHAVMDLLRDPTNRLPDAIRANLLSVGHAVQREMRGEAPDLRFLIEVNEQVAAGLAA